MKKGLFILLIFCFSLTIISCAKKDDSSSSSSSSGTTTTTTDDTTTTATTTPNACQIEGITSRNVSLFSTPTLSRHSEQSIGRVLYVDKSALSQYQTDDYLLLDQYDSDSVYVWNYVSNTMMEDMEPDNLLVQHLIKHLQLVFAIMVNILDTDLEVIR